MPLEFADYFPPECPPSHSFDAAGLVFRCVKTVTVQDSDFLDHVTLKLGLNYNLCARCALSVYRSLPEARAASKRWPKIGKFFASGTLCAEHGRCDLPNESGHINWWPFVGIVPLSFFKLVQEDVK